MRDPAVARLQFAERDLGVFARRLARSNREPTPRQLAELEKLKQTVREYKARL